MSGFDTGMLEWLSALRDPNIVQAFIWISELGRWPTVHGFAISVILLLLLYRHYVYAAGLAISVATCGLALLVLKGAVARARPPQNLQAYVEVWSSFPSAHAALAMALYGFLAFLVWRFVASRARRNALIVPLGMTIALVALGRLYLGVHYFTDVVAGLALGAFCAWLSARWVRFAARA